VYFSQNVIQVIKARMVKFGEARWKFMRKKKYIMSLMEKPEGKKPLGRPRSKRGIIFKWIFKM